MSPRKARLSADNGWGSYGRDPLAQRIHHLRASRFLSGGYELRNTHYLPEGTASPVVIVANHLSYADANVIEFCFNAAGRTQMANRLSRFHPSTEVCMQTRRAPARRVGARRQLRQEIVMVSASWLE
jgi:hypothetical protein